MLLPDYEKIAQDYKSAFKAKIEKWMAGDDKEDPYAMFKETADKIRAMCEKSEEGEEESQMEAKGEVAKVKSDAVEKEEEVSIDKVV